MKVMTTWIGILLIALGVTIFAYKGFSYNKQEKIAEIGSVKITANTQKTVYLSPILGGVFLVAGLGLVIFGRKLF